MIVIFPCRYSQLCETENRLSAAQGAGSAHYCSSSRRRADILYAIYLLVGMFIEAAQVKYLAQWLTADIELQALSHQVQFPNHNQFAPFEGWGLGEPAALCTTQTVIYSVSDIMLLHVTDWCYLHPFLPHCHPPPHPPMRWLDPPLRPRLAS